ncbi:MAG: EpsI family protein [Desulfamplus sp.]|nr:EpsI family protein [Desulfamplus sp.]
MEIGEWKGTVEKFEDRIYDALGVDDSVLATYRTEKKGSVHLYVGFYQSQKEGDLIHSPKNCLPGSGWNITQTAIESIDVLDGKESKNIDVIRLRLEKDSQKQVVLYWFHSRGKIVSSEYMQKIWLVIDSITKHRTDEAFVRLISPVVDDESQTIERMKAFAKELFPYLTEYIPS